MNKVSWEPPEGILLLFNKESEKEKIYKDVMPWAGVAVL